jgi:hypothetical protein
MGKLSWLFFFLLFMLGCGLFFAGGFLTCAVLFPSAPTSLVSSSSPLTGEGYPQIIHNNEQSYANRQALLHTLGSSRTYTLLQNAEQQSEDQAKKMGKSAIGMALGEWSQKILTTLGPVLGAVVVPMTTGLARNAVDAALTNTYPLAAIAEQPQNFAQSQPESTSPPAGKNVSTNNVTMPVDLYTVHIKDLPSMIDAHKLVNELRRRQFGAYIVRLSNPAGLIFSVRVGHFKGFKDAQVVATTLTEMWDYPVRVMRIDNNTNSTGIKR